MTSGAMNAGVPDVTWSTRQARAAKTTAAELHEPEVQDLHEVVIEPHTADVNVCRLDVAVHETTHVRLGKRVTDLPQ